MKYKGSGIILAGGFFWRAGSIIRSGLVWLPLIIWGMVSGLRALAGTEISGSIKNQNPDRDLKPCQGGARP